MGKRKSEGSTGHGGKLHRIGYREMIMRAYHRLKSKQLARRMKKIRAKREVA